MSTYTWPAAWVPRAFELYLQPNMRTFMSPYSTDVQALDLLGERWAGRIDLAPTNDALDAGRREAFFDRLKAQANKFSIYNFRRAAPLGDARGTITLGASAAQLANTATLAGCVGRNLLLYGGFELDGNADGTADGLSAYNAGTSSGRTYSRVGGNGSAYAQRVVASSLGSGSGDQVGFRWTAAVSVTAGVAYTMAVDLYATTGTSVSIEVDYYNVSSVQVGSPQKGTWSGNSVSYDRRTLTSTAPAGAVTAVIYVYMHSNSAGSPEFRADNAQFEAASAASAYSAGAWLYAGDMLGIGGQLVRTMADVQADDSGAIALEFQPRLRAAMAGGTAVTYSAPTCNVMLKPGTTMVPVTHVPGYAEALSFEFVEVP